MEIIVSDKISKDLLGVFANSFELSNFEYSLKTAAPEENEEEKKEVDEDEDPRVKVVKKSIKNFDIVSEDGSFKNEEDYKMWTVSAKATLLARNIANTRGSIANPDYMEE